MEVNIYQKNLMMTAQKAVAADVSPALIESAAATLPESVPLSQIALLTETLQLHGYKPTPENMQMLHKMLDAGVPLTKENIAHMHKAFKMTQNMDQALFLFQNQIPTTTKNAAHLNALAEGQFKITQQMGSLLEGVSQLQDASLKEKIMKLLDSFNGESTLNAEQMLKALQAMKNAQSAQTAQSTQAPTASSAEQALAQTQASAQTQAQAQASAQAQAPVKIIPQRATMPLPMQAAAQASTQASTQAPTQAPTPLPTPNAQIPTVPMPQQAAPAAAPAFGAAPTVQVATQAYSSFEATAPAATPTQSPAGASADAPVSADASSSSAQPASAQPASASAQPASAQPAPAQSTSTLAPAQPEAPQPAPQPLPMPTASTPTNDPTTPLRTFLPLPPNLSFTLQNSTPANVEDFINNLRLLLAQAQAQIQQHLASNPGNSGTARVMSDLSALSEHIDFATQIKNQIFVQIPIAVGDQVFNTAMYVNKDGKNAKGDKKNAGSALVALDTAFLGHFETYVQKEGQAVHCQFRLETEDIENLVRANIHKLDSQLKEYRYALESFTFIVGDRPFTLLDALEEQKNLKRSDTVFDAMA